VGSPRTALSIFPIENSPVQIFLSEYVVGGGWPDDQPATNSLLAEGRAMLLALVHDFSRLPDHRVVSTWSPRWGPPPTMPGVAWTLCQTNQDERAAFEHYAATSDATLIIAPETGGLLAERIQQAAAVSPRLLNCSPEVVQLTGDKFCLFEHLQARNVPTPATQLVNWQQPPDWQRGPWLVKPRDGAGSCLTFRLDNPADWQVAQQAYATTDGSSEAILQRYFEGQPGSMAAFFYPEIPPVWLPPARQNIAQDNGFSYHGGTIPWHVENCPQKDIERSLSMIAEAIGFGLQGYVGFDFLIDDRGNWTFLEVNPRLTSSYLGYRQLCPRNLAELWLTESNRSPTWHTTDVTFTPTEAANFLRTGERPA